MLLGVRDRLTLLRLLPTEGNFLTLKTIMELQSALLFTESETTDFELRQEGGIYRWNPANERETEVEIGELASEIIVRALKELDTQKKLTTDHFPLWERFVKEEI